MPISRCVKKLVDKSNGKITNDEAQKILKDADRLAKKLHKSGISKTDAVSQAVADRLKNVTDNLEKQKINTYRNIKIHTQITQRIQSRIDRGLKIDESILTELIGNARGANGMRNSIDLMQDTLTNAYGGGFIRELQNANVLDVLASGKFSRDIANDLWELSSKRAVRSPIPEVNKIAEIIHKNQTDMKNRLNKAGADIGEINGFIVSQSHDADKMRLAGKQKWIDTVKNKIDLERSFGGADDIDEALSSAFEALVTGIRETQLRPQNEKLFQFTAPSNLGKKISNSRELIFKTANDFMDYNDIYGRGNLNESLERGIRYAARNIALLERFGTNPQAMLDKIKDTILKNNRETLSKKGKINETLIKDSIDLVLGNLDHSVNPSLTRAVNNIKAYNNLRLLGGNLLSALSDIPSKAFEYRYQGRNIISSTLKTFTDFKAGFQSKQEQLNFASLTGVYVDSFIGDINARFNDSDDISSKASKAMRFFSKINGMNWWDRTHRISMAQTMSHDLALKSNIEFNNLDVDTKRNLGLYDIAADDWDNIRNSKRNLDGKDYIFSEDIKNRESSEKLMSYYIDRVNSGVVTQTGSTRARMAMGARRGTPIGEASQLILQFKSFMFAHVERVWGRAVYGKGYPDYAAMAQIIIMSTMFGYLSLTAKDFVRGKTPRDPFATETVFASMAQGGGLGIAGDLAFQDSGGFGKSLSDILAGPTFGTLNDAYKIYQAVKEGNDAKANAFRVGVGLIPGQNIFYMREPLNHVILYNIQEMLNPGSLSRMVANTKKDRNQDYFINPN